MHLVSWLSAGSHSLLILPTPLCQGWAESSFPNGCHGALPAFPQKIPSGGLWVASLQRTVLSFWWWYVYREKQMCMLILLAVLRISTDLGNPHPSHLGFGHFSEVLFDVHQSQESPWKWSHLAGRLFVVGCWILTELQGASSVWRLGAETVFQLIALVCMVYYLLRRNSCWGVLTGR